MPNPAEVAIVAVNGIQFELWESVYVQHPLADAWTTFRFTCAERDPIPDLWTRLQFKPGDECQIILAGVPAAQGMIITRQVAYDAKSHGVQLTGKGTTWAAATSSVNSATGSFDKMTFEQIARKCFASFPNQVKVIGKLNATPFESCQNEPGESNWDFLERLARVRGVILGSDNMGRFLLIGKHSAPIVQELIEGQNILRCQAVFNRDHTSRIYASRASQRGSDQQNGVPSNEVMAKINGSLEHLRYLEFVTEVPGGFSEAKMRVDYEALWREGTVVEVYITVQGWLRDGKNLWRPGDNVFVHSPMAMLQEVLKIQTVTFQQDRRSGTTTTLHLRLPWALNDPRNTRSGTAPGTSTAVTGPPQDPPKDPNKGDAEPRPVPPPKYEVEIGPIQEDPHEGDD